MRRSQRATAEFLGTFFLVLGGCGTAVLAPSAGLLGVSLAFGLSVAVMVLAFGPVSGGHFNPAVTLGLCVAGRFPWKEWPAYVIAQCGGAVGGAGLLWAIASSRAGFDTSAPFASNGYAAHSPGEFSLLACALAEVLLTGLFVFSVLGATAPGTSRAAAPVYVGGALTLVHLLGIPVTNLSVNPARSLGPAVFHGDWALWQLWLFWLAPSAGAALAAWAWRWLNAPVMDDDAGD